MTYQELIEQTKKFQAEALRISETEDALVYLRIEKLGNDLGDFAEALEHCRIAAS